MKQGMTAMELGIEKRAVLGTLGRFADRWYGTSRRPGDLRGPAAGMLAQSALIGLPAYALRRLYGKLVDEDPDDTRSKALRWGLLGALPGVAINTPGVVAGYRLEGLRGMNRDAIDRMRPL